MFVMGFGTAEALAMKLLLSTKKFATFLDEFRRADRANAPSRGETEVIYVGEGVLEKKYYFKAPNFELLAYDVGGGRVNLTTYNHVADMGTVRRDDLIRALQQGGGGGTVMNLNLSRVVALTSEAARSRVVEIAMTRALQLEGSADLNSLEFLFKAYKQPATYCGYLSVSGSYTSQWKPLEKTDYQRFFLSSSFTGDGKASHDAVTRL